MSSIQAISASLPAHIPPAMLVIFRIGGLAIYGPVLGSNVIPVRVRVMLSFILGLAVYPLLSRETLVGAPMQLDLLMLGPMVALELLIGLAIGFVASIPLISMQTGGLLMGQQMGLGFARFFNPSIDDEADILGQVLFFLALASFLLIGGHEYMLLAVLRSFEHIPLGGFAPDGGLIDLLLGLLLASFELALRVAMPLLAIVFIESVAMGFISKSVPQLNILSLGFPLRIIVGFAIVATGLAIMHDILLDDFNDTLTQLFDWIASPTARR